MGGHIFLAISIIISLIFGFLGDAQASLREIEPASKIQNIIIYTDRAMIKKEAVFSVRKGENIVRIAGVTANLIDQSVQVGIKWKSAVKISDVKVEKTYLQKTAPDKIQKLQSKLDNLNDIIRATTNEILVITSSTDFLKKIIPFPQNQRVTTSDVGVHVKYLEKSLSANYERVAKIENKLKKLNEEKKAVENELRNLSSADENSKSIVIYLTSPDDNKEIALSFSYIVAGAGWFPQYDVRADSGISKIELSCFANIKQSTGEDWKNVDIEISTAMPFVHGTPPELLAWYVDVYQPRPRVYKSKKGFDEVLASKAMELKAEQAPEMPFEEPEIKAEATSFSFVLPRKVDIPSDNQPHRILIASSAKDVKLNYYAVPKLSRYAYLRASLQNPFSFPLLPGNMNIFLDGKLVSTSSVDRTILASEDIRLSLGVDEGIKLERKLQRKFTEYAGVFSKDTKISYEYTIDVTSSKNKEINIDLNDNFPVSRNEQIKVERESPKKEEAAISEDGIISWNLKLSAGEKKNLKVKFSIEHPKDLRITGLE
ncbi:MAG: hypothetical protein C0415_06055 [Thermodesulfovibrio sp.]|nr:hypothetical protein [Thermodesulfovibrio sp.]